MNANFKVAARWMRIGYLPLLVMANVCVVAWGGFKFAASILFASEAPLCDYETLAKPLIGFYQALPPLVGNVAVELRASELGAPNIFAQGIFPSLLAILLIAHALVCEGFVKLIQSLIGGVSLAITLGTFLMDLGHVSEQSKIELAAFEQRATLQEMRPSATQLALQHPLSGQPESVRSCGIALQLVHAQRARICSFEQPLTACWSSQANDEVSAKALYSETRKRLLDPNRR